MSQQLKQKKKYNIIKSFYLFIILLVLLVTATYTWFSISRTPRVSDMALYINSGSGLELALEPESEEWTQQLDFGELLPEKTELKPVTWSYADQRFYTAAYGADGRIITLKEPLNDEQNANRSDGNGYYVKGIFYARTGVPVTVSLSPAVEIEEGVQGAGTYLIGTPVWDDAAVYHNNGGGGAEFAMRIGIRVTKTDRDGQEQGERPVFYIYEPNCDKHIDGSNGYIQTESIDGTETLVPQSFLLRQTSTTWTEAYPVQKNVVIRDMGEFITPARLFDLTPEELAKIEVYVWLEGQDVDCSNIIGQQARIFANLQFASDAGAQSGLVPIE